MTSVQNLTVVKLWGKTFQAAQLTHERFLTIDHSCKIFFWYLPNWTSTDLWCVVLYVTFSTTNQRSVEVKFGRYQKNILQEWSMVKNLSSVSYGSLKRFPHKFTTETLTEIGHEFSKYCVLRIAVNKKCNTQRLIFLNTKKNWIPHVWAS